MTWSDQHKSSKVKGFDGRIVALRNTEQVRNLFLSGVLINSDFFIGNYLVWNNNDGSREYYVSLFSSLN